MRAGAKRPTGILLLAVVCVLMAGCFILIATLMAVSPATLLSYGFGGGRTGAPRMSGAGLFATAGVLAGAVAYGLWRLEGWARSIVMLSALGPPVRGVISLAAGAAGGQPPDAAMLLAACGSLAVLWYLWTPNVRSAFDGHAGSAAAP